MAMKFEEFFDAVLEDLYDAEKQNAAALPMMIAAASSEKLSGELESHLEATREQISRLGSIFERIAEEPGTRDCRPMRALLEEADRLIAEGEKGPVLDAAIAAAAQKVEHYEIAAYRTACSLAEMLGQQDAFDLLQQTLTEEESFDESLADLNEAILSGDGAARVDETFRGARKTG